MVKNDRRANLLLLLESEQGRRTLAKAMTLLSDDDLVKLGDLVAHILKGDAVTTSSEDRHLLMQRLV